MNQHKTGDAFPNPRAPGDPRTLREISNRTPWIAGGAGEVHHVPGRTIITPAAHSQSQRASKIKPLQLVVSRPAYITNPATPVTGISRRLYLTWGTINNVIASNWDDNFDASGTVSTYFFAKVTFSTATDHLKVASWEILHNPASDAHATPEWEAGGVRPAYYVFSLGALLVSSLTVDEELVYTYTLQPAPTSRIITEHVSNIGGTGTAGAITLTKQITHYSV